MQMMKRSALLSAVAGVAMTAGSVMGQAMPEREQPQQPMVQAQAQGEMEAQKIYQRISPFVMQQTFGIARVDLSRLDLNQTEKWLNEVIRMLEADPAQQQAQQARLEAHTELTQNWVNSLRQVGVDEVFVAGYIRGDWPSWALIVPVKQGVDQEQVRKLLTPRVPMAAFGAETAAMHDAIVLAPRPTLDALRQTKPADLPLGQAMGAIGDAAIQFAFVPQDGLSRWFNQAVAPALGQGVKQGDLKNFPENMDWMAIAIGADQPTRVVFDAANESAAQEMALTINRILDQAQAKGTEPKVDGEQVAVTLTTEQANQLIEAKVDPVLKAVEIRQPEQGQQNQPQ